VDYSTSHGKTPVKLTVENFFFEKNETRLGDRFVTHPLPIEAFSIVNGLLHLPLKPPVKLTVENIIFLKKTRLALAIGS